MMIGISADLFEVVVLAADTQTLLAVGYPAVFGAARPRKISLNWFIPALANSRVSSPIGTSGELGTNV